MFKWISNKSEEHNRKMSRAMSCQMKTNTVGDTACVCGMHPDRMPR